MEKVVSYFTNQKKLLYFSCFLTGCALIFFNTFFQIATLAVVGALAAYFCKTFENKMLALFVVTYVITQIGMEIFHVKFCDRNLLIWSGLSIVIGVIQGIRKKDKVYIVILGALLMWFVSKWFHHH
jgi:predicted neutral ceramidase superfamily lipid hydrolase